MKHALALLPGLLALLATLHAADAPTLVAALQSQKAALERPPAPALKKGEKQLFVDSVMIRSKQGVTRVVHPAKKREQPVLTAEMPWEVRTQDGVIDKRVNIYGTVLRDEKTGSFRMWYADPGSVLYATSSDGLHWERPTLRVTGKNNETDLHLHSPSIIEDKFEADPTKRYKAVGNASRGVDDARLQRLKEKFELVDSFIDKLKDTDVDAVMCCPTMWRTALYPSEIDTQWKRYTAEQKSPKFPSYDRMMGYIHGGGDPVKETLEACRRNGKDFFVSCRMNDQHYIGDPTWPTHNAIWREHPEYWLGDSDSAAAKGGDNVRLLNYMLPEVRDYYFSILRELCTNYDVDGVELDFQRFPKFFRSADLEAGRSLMTAFVRRIKTMMDDIGRERGKSLKLCIRIPETLAKCEAAGLDIPEWDKQRLVEMINVSSFYTHTIELGIEEFRAATRYGKIYGEMNYLTYQESGSTKGAGRRYTTFETYRASALNLFHRGADGLSLFNYDYVPADQRTAMAAGLKRITDLDFLRTMSKDYVISSGFGTFPAKDEKTVELVIPDDTAVVRFSHAVLRVETKQGCAGLVINARLNGQMLAPMESATTELFPPVSDNPSYPVREALKFYAVPLSQIAHGKNTIQLSNADPKKGMCDFRSLELAIYQ